jgi:hypothetical protein
MDEQWPALPYEDWRETRDTLHMYLQVIGKVRLALAPFEPQWANVPLYVTARGLTTSPIAYESRSFQIDVDFIDHKVELEASDSAVQIIPLEPRPVADFYRELMSALEAMRIEVEITQTPSEVTHPIPFPEDSEHHSYDAAAAHRFWSVLARIDIILKQHHARFRGKTSPVQFFWGGLDLATTRFSGRDTEPHGDDIIMRLSSDQEQICAGWWAGSDRVLQEPAFFSYADPKPDGIGEQPIRPDAARWREEIGLFVLRYDDVRESADPKAAILDFLESTYEAGARLLDWDPRLVLEGDPRFSPQPPVPSPQK